MSGTEGDSVAFIHRRSKFCGPSRLGEMARHREPEAFRAALGARVEEGLDLGPHAPEAIQAASSEGRLPVDSRSAFAQVAFEGGREKVAVVHALGARPASHEAAADMVRPMLEIGRQEDGTSAFRMRAPEEFLSDVDALRDAGVDIAAQGPDRPAAHAWARRIERAASVAGSEGDGEAGPRAAAMIDGLAERGVDFTATDRDGRSVRGMIEADAQTDDVPPSLDTGPGADVLRAVDRAGQAGRVTDRARQKVEATDAMARTTPTRDEDAR